MPEPTNVDVPPVNSERTTPQPVTQQASSETTAAVAVHRPAEVAVSQPSAMQIVVHHARMCLGGTYAD